MADAVVKLIEDFGARTEFAAVLLPHSEHSYAACLALANSMTNLLAVVRSGTLVGPAGELLFSGNDSGSTGSSRL